MRIITEKKFKEGYPNCHQQMLNLKLDMSNLNSSIYEILFKSGIDIITLPYYNNNDIFKGYNAKIRVNSKNIFKTNPYETPVISCKDDNKAQKHASLFALNIGRTFSIF